jgi:hypothetical protein
MTTLPWDNFRRFSRGYLVDSVVRIHPRIIVGAGGHLTPQFAIKHNIQYVVNCAFDEHSPPWFRLRYPYNYECMEAIDAYDVNITDWYPRFRDAIDKFMNQPNGQIFVHCQMGMNRSAFLAMLYVCVKYNYDIESCIRVMTKGRPCVFGNELYRKQVVDFIEKHRAN